MAWSGELVVFSSAVEVSVSESGENSVGTRSAYGTVVGSCSKCCECVGGSCG